jgi:hypothetical protein
MNDESVRLSNSGLLRRFVIKQQGRWNHDDWLSLLAQVRAAGYNSLSADDVGRMLETEGADYRRKQPNDQKPPLVADSRPAPEAIQPALLDGTPKEVSNSSQSTSLGVREPSRFAPLVFTLVGLVFLGGFFTVLFAYNVPLMIVRTSRYVDLIVVLAVLTLVIYSVVHSLNDPIVI